MNHKKKFFTLVELLVVVAIIAILASLLLPALGRAKKVARSISCSSNLKLMGMGFGSYLNDSADTFIPWSYQYVGGLDNAYWSWGWQMSSLGYLHDKILVCPTGVGIYESGVNYVPLQKTGTWTYQWMHYGYNWTFIGSNRGDLSNNIATARTNNIRVPSATILNGDSVNTGSEPMRGCFVIQPQNGTYGHFPDLHQRASNILWVDFHVSHEQDACSRFQDGGKTYLDRN